MEDRSTSTEENMKFAIGLICEKSGKAEPKLAFATTNYHVFRAGVLASEQGILAEGIGSKTKRYFRINAFVREFMATLYAERKTHLAIIAVMMLIELAMVAIVCVSNLI